MLHLLGNASNRSAITCFSSSLSKLNLSVPEHIAIIMDGNGRWAQQRFLPRTAGHAKGAAGVKALLEACARMGVRYLTLFAFSTENWKRPQDEVSTLMTLFIQYLEKELGNLNKAGVRLKVIGDIHAFPAELQKRICNAEALTADNTTITLIVAANYGGRWDIAQAARHWLVANPGAGVDALTEDALAAHLSTADWPEPDLLIRTGGEKRISNFLLWQSAYSELYFSDMLWPEFDASALQDAVAWFQGRHRRFGQTQEQTRA